MKSRGIIEKKKKPTGIKEIRMFKYPTIIRLDMAKVKKNWTIKLI